MRMVARGAVVLGAVDPSVTSTAGVALVGELDRILGVTGCVDGLVASVGPRAGWSPGELVFSMAEVMLCGGDFMADLDHTRDHPATTKLRAVRLPSGWVFGSLSRRFEDSRVLGLEQAVGKELVRRWWATLPNKRREVLGVGRPTIDLDTTEVEVYGTKKEKVSYNYQGQRVGRVHCATWAEAGLVVAGRLGSAENDPRPEAAAMIATAVAALPAGLGCPVVRADSGYHDHKIAEAAVELGCGFAIAVKRNNAVWRAGLSVAESAWRAAKNMAGAQVAVCGYIPPGWPPGSTCVVRRVPVGEIPTRRARRRRTIPPAQQVLALLGLGPAWAYSFIMTNLTGDPVEIEAWFRGRAQIEGNYSALIAR